MGGDLNGQHRHADPDGFNPRPRMGGDISLPLFVPLFASFNPRPRMGGDTIKGRL